MRNSSTTKGAPFSRRLKASIALIGTLSSLTVIPSLSAATGGVTQHSPHTHSQTSAAKSPQNANVTTTQSPIMGPIMADTMIWQPFKATYQIKSSKVPFTGNVERSLSQNDAGQWVANSTAKAFASKVYETSHFTLGQNCLVKSNAFSYKRKVFGKTKAWTITTDWTSKQFKYESHKTSQTVPFTGDALADRLSEQFSVRCFVATGADTFSIDTVRRDELKTQLFKRIGQENLETALGTLETIKIEKQHDSDSRETHLWFSPKHNFRLVKLVQTDEDETLTIEIKSLP